jgi:hypothetical protein
MRKNFIFLFGAVLSLSGLKAQVVLDSTMAPSHGTTIWFAFLDDPSSFVFEKTGGNLVWDFTIYTATDTDTVFYDDPANTPYFDDFPDATHAVYQEEDGIGFIQNTAGYYWLIGAAASDEDTIYIIEFDPPTTLLSFPYTYGSTINDTTAFSFIDSGEAFGFPTIDSVHYKVSIINDRDVQAWGSLILPHATYDSTLLEKAITTQIDSLWMKVPFFGWIPLGEPEIFTDSSFRWLTDVILHPYAEVYYEEGEISSVNYFFDNTVSARSIARKEVAGFNIYPNPVRSSLNLQSEEFTFREARVTIFNMNGRAVYQFDYPSISPAFTIDVSNLRPGFYTLVVQTAGHRASGKFLKINE